MCRYEWWASVMVEDITKAVGRHSYDVVAENPMKAHEKVDALVRKDGGRVVGVLHVGLKAPLSVLSGFGTKGGGQQGGGMREGDTQPRRIK